MSQLITTRGTKKDSFAVCKCTDGKKFEIRINKIPLSIHPDTLMISKFEEILKIIPEEVYNNLDFEITTSVREGGSVGRIYSARQAFCKAILSYLGMYSDEYKRQEVKNAILKYDRFAIVADTRAREPKKFGGPGARARYQKSHR
jgi:small subunit ribosomal protein S16e